MRARVKRYFFNRSRDNRGRGADQRSACLILHVFIRLNRWLECADSACARSGGTRFSYSVRGILLEFCCAPLFCTLCSSSTAIDPSIRRSANNRGSVAVLLLLIALVNDHGDVKRRETRWKKDSGAGQFFANQRVKRARLVDVKEKTYRPPD